MPADVVGCLDIALTEEDRSYLRDESDAVVSGAPEDPLAQGVHAVQDLILDLDTAVWTLAEAKAVLQQEAARLRVHVLVSAHKEPHAGVFVYPCARLGLIQLPQRGMAGEFRPAESGQYAPWVPLHELSHVLTPALFRRPARYGTAAFQSHGPEFLAVYLSLLQRYGLAGRRVREAVAFLGMQTAPLDEDVRRSLIDG